MAAANDIDPASPNNNQARLAVKALAKAIGLKITTIAKAAFRSLPGVAPAFFTRFASSSSGSFSGISSGGFFKAINRLILHALRTSVEVVIITIYFAYYFFIFRLLTFF